MTAAHAAVRLIIALGYSKHIVISSKISAEPKFMPDLRGTESGQKNFKGLKKK